MRVVGRETHSPVLPRGVCDSVLGDPDGKDFCDFLILAAMMGDREGRERGAAQCPASLIGGEVHLPGQPLRLVFPGPLTHE